MALQEIKESNKAQYDSLAEAMAPLLKNKSKKTNRRRRQPSIVTEDSSDKSSEEEIETPPRKRKRKRERKNKTLTATSNPNDQIPAPSNKGYKIGVACHPSMQWDISWTKEKKEAYTTAHQEFHNTGTKEALADKIEGIKNALKKRRRITGTIKKTSLSFPLQV